MTATPGQRRRPTMLAAAVVLAVLAASLAPAAALAELVTPVRPLGAQLVLDSHTTMFDCGNCGPGGSAFIPSCQFAVFVQFSPVPDAVSYNVVVKDTDPRVAPSRTLTGPPFNDVGPSWVDEPGEFRAPAGTHRLGPLTGGGGGVCPTDPTLNGRLSISKAVAIFPPYCKGQKPSNASARSLAWAADKRSAASRTALLCGSGYFALAGSINGAAGYLLDGISGAFAYFGPEGPPVAKIGATRLTRDSRASSSRSR